MFVKLNFKLVRAHYVIGRVPDVFIAFKKLTLPTILYQLFIATIMTFYKPP